MHHIQRITKPSKLSQFKVNAISCIIFAAFTSESALCSTTKSIAQLNPSSTTFGLNSIYEPRFTFDGEAGSYGLGQLDVMYPFIRRENSLFMVDGRFERGRVNFEEGKVGYNLGLVYRQLVYN